MKNEELEQKWTDEAMASIDGLPRAEANPFLFTRIQERLRRQNSPWEKAASFVAKPAFAMVIIIVFLAANFFAAAKEKQNRLAREKQTNEQMFASEFNSGSSLSNEITANPSK